MWMCCVSGVLLGSALTLTVELLWFQQQSHLCGVISRTGLSFWTRDWSSPSSAPCSIKPEELHLSVSSPGPQWRNLKRRSAHHWIVSPGLFSLYSSCMAHSNFHSPSSKNCLGVAFFTVYCRSIRMGIRELWDTQGHWTRVWAHYPLTNGFLTQSSKC